MLLPYIYRVSVKNETNTTIPGSGISVTALRNKINISGTIEYESSEATILLNANPIPSTGFYEGSIQTNSQGWYGGDFICSAPAISIGQNQQVLCYFERATSSVFDASGNGLIVAVLNSGALTRSFSI